MYVMEKQNPLDGSSDKDISFENNLSKILLVGEVAESFEQLRFRSEPSTKYISYHNVSFDEVHSLDCAIIKDHNGVDGEINIYKTNDAYPMETYVKSIYDQNWRPQHSDEKIAFSVWGMISFLDTRMKNTSQNKPDQESDYRLLLNILQRQQNLKESDILTGLDALMQIHSSSDCRESITSYYVLNESDGNTPTQEINISQISKGEINVYALEITELLNESGKASLDIHRLEINEYNEPSFSRYSRCPRTGNLRLKAIELPEKDLIDFFRRSASAILDASAIDKRS